MNIINMKTVKQIIIAIILITTLNSLISCENESQIENKTIENQNKTIENNIGFYHNLALDRSLEKFNKNSSIDEIRNSIINVLKKENSDLFNNKTISSLTITSDILKNTNLVSKHKRVNEYDFSTVFNGLYENGNISKELNNKLNEINTNIIEKKISEISILEKVNNLKNNNWNDKDDKYINAYIQVFNASHEFWTNRNDSKNCAQDCNLAMIGADAAGALYGMIGGPIMSIVQSALFSGIAAIGPVCDCDVIQL